MNKAWLTNAISGKKAEEVREYMKPIESFINDPQKEVHTIEELKTFLKAFVMLWSIVREEGIVIAASGGAAVVTPELVERLISAVVAGYLRQWFMNTNNPQCTIYEFSNYKYMHPSDAKYTGERKMRDNPDRKALENAMKKQRSFLDLRLGQILQKSDATIQKEPGKQKYDYVNLAWIDQYHEGYLGYIGLIFQRKEIMRQTQNKERYEPLGEACKQYRNGLQRVSELYPRIQTSGGKYRVALCREYVASCMLTAWLESGVSFHRACRIAAHLTGAYPQQQQANEDAADCFWRPAEANNDTREVIRGYGKEGIKQLSYPWDLLHYDEEIACVFGEYSTETEQKCIRNLVLREKYLELRNLLYVYRPPEKQPRWTPELYLEAAKFFHDEYPIVEQYAAMEFPEIQSVYDPLEEGQTRRRGRTLDNDFYQNLKKVFLVILDMEESPLDFARQYFRNTNKKKN